MLSTYRWQGQVEESSEVLLLVKTSLEQMEPLGQWVREHHPYDVPEIISFQMAEVERAYGAWLEQNL